MAKTCTHEGCNYPVFAKDFCKFHQYLRTDKKPSVKKTYKIPNISDKMKENLKEYRIVRDKYMAEHRNCEFKGCNRDSDDLHHKEGRGLNLSKTETFMAICRIHHTWIHENSKEARDLGYLI